MTQRILVTGGAGFIGHHFVDHIIRNTDWEVIILDRLSYASNGFDRLRDSRLFDESRISIFTHDFTKPIVDGLAQEIRGVDYIVHMGAETHVDRSISDPRPFVFSNVVGTLELLEFARTLKGLKKLIYFSTDEVFGPSPGPNHSGFLEWDRYKSSTPYAASKAGGEELAIAYENTYKVPVIIIHTMNVFGERQHPEKFIPLAISKVLKGEEVPIHWDPIRQEYSTRCWIHARNVADAVLFLLLTGKVGDKYNVVGTSSSNHAILHLIGHTLGKVVTPKFMDAKEARAGHDMHYALDGTKMREMGWKHPVNAIDSLTRTIQWFARNPKWLKF